MKWRVDSSGRWLFGKSSRIAIQELNLFIQTTLDEVLWNQKYNLPLWNQRRFSSPSYLCSIAVSRYISFKYKLQQNSFFCEHNNDIMQNYLNSSHMILVGSFYLREGESHCILRFGVIQPKCSSKKRLVIVNASIKYFSSFHNCFLIVFE